MPPSSRTVAASLLASAALLLGACDNPTPGEPLGTFAVTSALSVDTCGGTVADADPGDFTVIMSNDNGVIHWFPQTGGSAVSGSLGANGTVKIDEEVTGNVDGVDGGNGPCTLDRMDTLTFTLPSATAPQSFVGSYGFSVSPASGASCSDQLTTYGGGYGALPCTVTYNLTGKRQ
jgi:hypothetical protein